MIAFEEYLVKEGFKLHAFDGKGDLVEYRSKSHTIYSTIGITSFVYKRNEKEEIEIGLLIPNRPPMLISPQVTKGVVKEGRYNFHLDEESEMITFSGRLDNEKMLKELLEIIHRNNLEKFV